MLRISSVLVDLKNIVTLFMQGHAYFQAIPPGKPYGEDRDLKPIYAGENRPEKKKILSNTHTFEITLHTLKQGIGALNRRSSNEQDVLLVRIRFFGKSSRGTGARDN